MYVGHLDDKAEKFLGQLVTKEVFGNNGFGYTHLPIQRSYDEVHTNPNFKKMMMDYSIHNREVFLKTKENGEGIILSNPIVIEVEGKLKYGGKPIKFKFKYPDKVDNVDDVYDTLVKAGLLKEPEHKVYKHYTWGTINFDCGGGNESATWSTWMDDCFSVNAWRIGSDVTAFMKTNEIEKTEIAKWEYESLMKASKKLKELRLVLNDFKSRI